MSSRFCLNRKWWVLPACFLLYCCYILQYTHITTALIGNDGCFLHASFYTTAPKLNWKETHTSLPTFLESMQEAPMGASCVLPSVASLTGRSVWIKLIMRVKKGLDLIVLTLNNSHTKREWILGDTATLGTTTPVGQINNGFRLILMLFIYIYIIFIYIHANAFSQNCILRL